MIKNDFFKDITKNTFWKIAFPNRKTNLLKRTIIFNIYNFQNIYSR